MLLPKTNATPERGPRPAAATRQGRDGRAAALEIAACYVRVSTVDKGQDLNVQIDPLREWVARLGYEPVVYAEEGVSGAKTTRPVLDAMMKAVRRREVQAVAVWKLDRLGRSLEHLLQLLSEFQTNGVRLLVHDMAMDTSTPQGKLFFSMVGAFAEFERGMIAERVKDGLAYALAHGTKSGRPIGRPPLEIDVIKVCDALRGRLRERGAIAEVARRFGVSRGWIHKHVVPLIATENRGPN